MVLLVARRPGPLRRGVAVGERRRPRPRAGARGRLADGVGRLPARVPPPAAAARQARALARRAAELDDGLPATRLASGLVRLLFDGDLAGADALIRAAVADDGEDARGPIVLAILALAQGRFDEASRLTGEELAVPHATAGALLHARARQAIGDSTGAAAAYERLLAREPGLEAARVGRAELEARRGRPGAARALARSCADEGVPLPDAMRACLAAGETGRARDLLRIAVNDGWPHAVLVPRDPAYAPLGAWADVAALRAEARGLRVEAGGGAVDARRTAR